VNETTLPTDTPAERMRRAASIAQAIILPPAVGEFIRGTLARAADAVEGGSQHVPALWVQLADELLAMPLGPATVVLADEVNRLRGEVRQQRVAIAAHLCTDPATPLASLVDQLIARSVGLGDRLADLREDHGDEVAAHQATRARLDAAREVGDASLPQIAAPAAQPDPRVEAALAVIAEHGPLTPPGKSKAVLERIVGALTGKWDNRYFASASASARSAARSEEADRDDEALVGNFDALSQHVREWAHAHGIQYDAVVKALGFVSTSRRAALAALRGKQK
jgi:hypothetical protein